MLPQILVELFFSQELFSQKSAEYQESLSQEKLTQLIPKFNGKLLSDNPSITRLDLRDIRIPGADLSVALLDEADLRESDLTGVRLDRASLCATQLCKSCMNKVEFGQLPYLEHAAAIDYIAFSPGGMYLASVQNCTIHLWELS